MKTQSHKWMWCGHENIKHLKSNLLNGTMYMLLKAGHQLHFVHNHILFCKRGRGLVTYFIAVCCTTLCSAGPITVQNSVTRVLLSQPQYEITGCKLTIILQAAALSVSALAQESK